MSSIAFETWLGQSKAIEIADQVYQNTKTTITFTVLESGRTAYDLTGRLVKFAAKKIDDGTTQFDKECVITDAAGGIATCSLADTDLDDAGECLGELNIFESDMSGADVIDRVQFRFKIGWGQFVIWLRELLKSHVIQEMLSLHQMLLSVQI